MENTKNPRRYVGKSLSIIEALLESYKLATFADALAGDVEACAAAALLAERMLQIKERSVQS